MMSQAINEEQKERSLHALNPMVLLALIVFLCFLASYIVPAGEYARILDPVIDKEIVDPASFLMCSKSPFLFLSPSIPDLRAAKCSGNHLLPFHYWRHLCHYGSNRRHWSWIGQYCP